jgi:hypothetical protein
VKIKWPILPNGLLNWARAFQNPESIMTELKNLVLYAGYDEAPAICDSDASIWSSFLASIEKLFIMGGKSGCPKGQDQFAAWSHYV